MRKYRDISPFFLFDFLFLGLLFLTFFLRPLPCFLFAAGSFRLLALLTTEDTEPLFLFNPLPDNILEPISFKFFFPRCLILSFKFLPAETSWTTPDAKLAAAGSTWRFMAGSKSLLRFANVDNNPLPCIYLFLLRKMLMSSRPPPLSL